ncbi:fungal-specific transcription factor domain-containing protein [Trichoderma barbatum]
MMPLKPSRHSMSPEKQGVKRCWNCRKLKIACDKTVPSCHTCGESGRVCLGYGLKLSWPRDTDNRRFTRPKGLYTIPVKSPGLHFVNTSVEDIEAFRCQALARYDHKTFNSMWFPQRPQQNIARLDPFLASHSFSPVALLISSSQNANDLYGLLIRLSLTDDSLPSLASRCAISALSYQCLGVETAAVMSQTNAIRALQAAIETHDPSQAMQMMAASMLLCIFETLNFDTSAIGWSIFFCGTKRIANQVTQTHDTYFGDRALLMDWIFYYDVMYKFSIQHWKNKNNEQIELAKQKKIISKAIFAPERQVVVPLLGCSLELLDILCQVIDAIYDRDDLHYQSESHMSTLKSLEIRLRILEQRHSGVLRLDTDEGVHESKIAELFRLATLTYLFRLANREPGDSEAVAKTVRSAFDILSTVKYCERPWPLFVIALEARTEQQRTIVSTVLKGSLQKQPLGTMALVNRMIHDAWIQQDLHEDEMDPLVLYGRIISRNNAPPCFT